MKKLFLAVLAVMFLLIPVFGFAADKTLNFAWEQPTITTDNLSGWVLYQSNTAGSGYVKVTDIPYFGTPSATYTVSTILVVTGTPGTTVTKYFVLTAKSQDGTESVYSNEVTQAFKIPYPVPGAPFNLIIKVTVAP
jgi:hypothetical protein